MTIFDWILRIAGAVALVLGLLIWAFQLDNITNIHMLFGLLVTLALLVISFLATLTRGLRLLGIIGIVYAFVLPLLGVNQETLLVGNLHWLIQVLHLLVGVGALVLAGVISMRYRRLKQARPAAL
jgi:flagellar motor component MotA